MARHVMAAQINTNIKKKASVQSVPPYMARHMVPSVQSAVSCVSIYICGIPP
jgi:hypothetical protein